MRFRGASGNRHTVTGRRAQGSAADGRDHALPEFVKDNTPEQVVADAHALNTWIRS